MQRPTHAYVRVKRAFMLGGKEQPVGAVLHLPIATAVEVISSNKAERTTAPEPTAPESKPAAGAAKAPSKGV